MHIIKEKKEMKRMKKIALILVVALLFSVVVLPISASAASPKAEDVAYEGNCSPKVAALYVMVYAANESIELAVRLAQLTPYNDVKALLCTVEFISAGVKAYAASIGAEVACEYTEYVIDGQKVLIDPLRVINIPGQVGGDGGR